MSVFIPLPIPLFWILLSHNAGNNNCSYFHILCQIVLYVLETVNLEKEDIFYEGLLVANWTQKKKIYLPFLYRGLSNKPPFRERSALKCLPTVFLPSKVALIKEFLKFYFNKCGWGFLHPIRVAKIQNPHLHEDTPIRKQVWRLLYI